MAESQEPLDDKVVLYCLPSNLDFLGGTNALKAFKQRQDGISYLVFILDNERYHRVTASGPKEKMEVSDLGHVVMLYNYVKDRLREGKLSVVELANQENYRKRLEELFRQSPPHEGQSKGYIVCDERVKNDVMAVVKEYLPEINITVIR
ncbi:hypothetical protein HYY69_02835 [Candidatus Woesearchaeota archaeon]|nr:hypothetical protein [Candidatus Woesearchaeota archaeon]